MRIERLRQLKEKGERRSDEWRRRIARNSVRVKRTFITTASIYTDELQTPGDHLQQRQRGGIYRSSENQAERAASLLQFILCCGSCMPQHTQVGCPHLGFCDVAMETAAAAAAD